MDSNWLSIAKVTRIGNDFCGKWEFFKVLRCLLSVFCFKFNQLLIYEFMMCHKCHRAI